MRDEGVRKAAAVGQREGRHQQVSVFVDVCFVLFVYTLDASISAINQTKI